MANVTGQGRMLPGEDRFEFSLDGVSTSQQMERLIKLSSEMLKTWDSTKTGLAKNLEQASAGAANFTRTISDASDDLGINSSRLTSAFSRIITGDFKSLAREFDNGTNQFAFAAGSVVGALTGYTDKLGEAMQRGISGGLFDFAIAAKTAGVSMEAFTKAIVATAGGFASLGVGATDGAKQFGLLVGQVRAATASVGNMGLTNEQQAMFAAQQLKVAISQGYKGQAAQEIVVQNSRALAEELDILANRTGKSVLELAQSGMKLAQDPIVASFVKSASDGGKEISKSIQQFGATLRGVFGELGEATGLDLIKSSMGNLPFVVTQSGKNILLGSQRLYSEYERLAAVVKRGGEITADDQERLRNIALEEVEARGQELRMLSNLEGAIGDSARQMLALAKEAEFYNSEAGKKRRQEDQTAQQFNAQLREFQANLQALAIPLLQLVNAIDWKAFISVINTAIGTIDFLLTPLRKLAEIIGGSGGMGTLIGTILGGIAVFGMFSATMSSLTVISKLLSMRFGHLGVAIERMMYKMGMTSGGGINRNPYMADSAAAAGKGKKGAGILGGLLGAGIGMGVVTPEGGGTTAGAVGGLVGSIGLGALGGAAAGRLLGGALGGFAGPIGIAIGSALGGAIGQWAGDALGSSSSGNQLSAVGADALDENQRIAQQSTESLRNIERGINTLADQNGVNLALTNQGNSLARDQVRSITGLQYRIS